MYARAGIDKPGRKGPLPRPAAPTRLEIRPKTNGKTGEWSDERTYPFGTSESVARASASIEAKPASCVAKSA